MKVEEAIYRKSEAPVVAKAPAVEEATDLAESWPERFIRVREVAKGLGVSVSTVYKIMAAQPEFPRPIALSERTVVWSDKEVRDWMEFKKTQPRHLTLHPGRRRKPNTVS
ncbi:MAG: AlpA family phage regulatory protein [Deltaproteobacteria bacterium]|jgi:predicted DNA-binding transcriptional regulator AlpA|nr:AlpA family phage regulatory protein [Deltaproteobacteria bacterium]